MSYNPFYEAPKALLVEEIVKQLEDFAAAGQDPPRRRFSRSFPSVSSAPSTVFETGEPPSPSTVLIDKESRELDNSTADSQFYIQIRDEIDRIRAAKDKGLLQQPHIFDLDEAAKVNVEYRWMQQGIWDERWGYYKIWKHELHDSQSSVPSKSLKDGGATNWKTGTNRRYSDLYSDLKDEYDESIRCAVDFQNQQSSRPCYQFLYQCCQGREWIKLGLSTGDRDQNDNLNTRAYENLKSR